MTIVVVANDEQWNALTADPGDIKWVKTADLSFDQYANADVFFILEENSSLNYAATTKPVFINSVTKTLQELNMPANVLRINGWNGFLQRPVWEIAGTAGDDVKTILEKIGKKMIPVKDEPGLVAATIIAMIINEAYFAWGEHVSSKEDIDTAMKLGTNYPYGPFEWAGKIGIYNIFNLLHKLSLSDNRYQPAPALIDTIQNNNEPDIKY
jgi:3-hydroxybutyryl-CoA dehydrogenase